MRNLKEGVDMGTVRCSPPSDDARATLTTCSHSTWESTRMPQMHLSNRLTADSFSEPYTTFALHKKASLVLGT